jgi:zinc protease
MRKLSGRALLAAACALALGSRCGLFGSRVDPSWAPLRSAAQARAMAATLVPETELGLDVPRFAVEQRELPSGLRLGVESSPARGQVAVVLAMGVGASADPAEREGLAHLVEHLVYRARPGGQPPLADRFVRLGAAYNADTSLEATRFYEVIPASALPAALAIVGELLAHPLDGVDETDFERERSIVENELAERNELGVYGQVVAWIQGALHPPGHPYARPIGGSAASLARLTLADARRFAAAHYRPEDATLLVSGEIGGRSPMATVVARLPDALKRGSTAHAAPRPVPAAAPARGAAPDMEGEHQDTLRAAVALPELWIAWDLGGGKGAPSAVNRILVGPAAEAIVRERLLREPEVLGVAFHPIDVRDQTWLACQIVLENDRRRVEIARKARNLVWALWSDAGPPAAVDWEGWRQGTVLDLRRAALAEAVLGAEPFLERALDRTLAFQTSGAVDGYDRMLGTIATVRLADVSGRAYELLAPEHARTLLLAPLDAAERPRGPVGLRGAGDPFAEAGPARGGEVWLPPRVPPPAGMGGMRVQTLTNGLTVVVVPRPQFPSVTVLLGFHGGAAALPPGVLELVRAVEPRRDDGGRSSALAIEESDGPGWTADLVHTDRRHISNALFLLADRLKAIAETDWAHLLERAQSRRPPGGTPPEEPRKKALARLTAALYGDHPYARKVGRDEVRGLDPDLVREWLPRVYNPRNAVLVVAGDIDPGAAMKFAAGWFSDWAGAAGRGRLDAPVVPPPAAGAGRAVAAAASNRETVIITPRPVATQVEVAFGCRLAPADGPRAIAADRAIAGLLGGRLTAQIREQAGAAYSVDSAAAVLPGGGAHLLVSMSVDSRRLRDALRVLRADLDGVAAGRFDKAALDRVRFGLAREASLRYQTSQEVAEGIFEGLALGLPADSVATEADDLARVDGRDLARAFAPCLAKPILSLVGDETIIRSAL